MENYFTFNQKVLATLGISFTEKEKKFDKPLRILSLVIVITASLQSVMFLITATHFDLDLANAFTIGLYSIQGCFKIVAVLWNIEKLKDLRSSLNKLMTTMKADKDEENSREMNKFRLVTKVCLITNVTCIWIFHFKPLLELISFYLAEGIIVKKTPFAFFYPFKKREHFVPIYFYEIIFGHFLTIVPQAVDGLVMLLVGQVVVLYRSLGDRFMKTFNEFEAKEPSLTVEKMKKVIDLQNIIFDLSDKLFHIYEVPLLANVVLQTGTICFIAFIVSVRTKFDVDSNNDKLIASLTDTKHGHGYSFTFRAA
jgi:7tm Odorant receptor